MGTGSLVTLPSTIGTPAFPIEVTAPASNPATLDFRPESRHGYAGLLSGDGTLRVVFNGATNLRADITSQSPVVTHPFAGTLLIDSTGIFETAADYPNMTLSFGPNTTATTLGSGESNANGSVFRWATAGTHTVYEIKNLYDGGISFWGANTLNVISGRVTRGENVASNSNFRFSTNSGDTRLTSSSGTLTFDTTTAGAINVAVYTGDYSASVPLKVVKEGSGIVYFSQPMRNTNGMTVNEGTVVMGEAAIPTTGVSTGRNGWHLSGPIIVNPNGTLWFAGYMVNNSSDTNPVSYSVVLNGNNVNRGKLVGNSYNRLTEITLNGGELHAFDSYPDNSNWGAWNIRDTLKVTADGLDSNGDPYTNENPLISYITSTKVLDWGEGIRMGYSGSVGNGLFNFDVADGAKLIVEASVRNDTGNRNPGYNTGLRKTGAGVMELLDHVNIHLSSNSSNVANNMDQYRGATVVEGGKLVIARLGDSASFTVNNAGSVLEIGDNATGTVTTAPYTLTDAGTELHFNRSALPLNIAGTVTGPGNIRKSGSSDVTLSSASGVSGALLVEAGNLIFSGAAPTSATRVEVGSGAVLDLGATTTLALGSGHTSFGGHSNDLSILPTPPAADIVANLSLSGHALRVGSHATNETLILTGSLALANSHLEFDINNGYTDLIRTSALTATGDNVISVSGDVETWQTGMSGGGTRNFVLVESGAYISSADFLTFRLDISGLRHPEISIQELAFTNNTLVLSARFSNGNLFWNNITNTGTASEKSWDIATTPNWWSQTDGTRTYSNDNLSVTFDDDPSRVSSTDVNIVVSVTPFGISVDTESLYVFTNKEAGKITGPVSLSKEGTGTLRLQVDSGAQLNDFTRPIYINSGAIELSGEVKLIGDKRVPDPSSMDLYSISNPGEANSLLGAGKEAGDLTLNGGTLRFNGSAGNATSTNRNFTIGNNPNGGTIEVASTAPGTRVWFRGDDTAGATALTNTVALAGSGLHILKLSGAGGADAISGANATAATSTTAGGIFSLTLTDGGSGEVLALEKTGTGVWHINGVNTFTGGLTVREGLLTFADPAALGLGTITLAGGALGIADISADALTLLDNAAPLDHTLTQTFSLAGGALRIPYANRLTISGTNRLQGTGRLIKSDTGTLLITNNHDSNNGGFTGGTLIQGGVLEAGSQYALGRPQTTLTTFNEGSVSFEGGASSTLRLNNTTPGDVNNVNVSWLAGAGTVESGRAAGTTSVLILDISSLLGYAPDFSGTFADGSTGSTLNLRKTGAGTQIISGISTFTGTTSIEQGVLRLGDVRALADSKVTVSSESGVAGTLDAAGLNFSARDAGGNLLAQPEVTLTHVAASVIDSTGGATLPSIILDADGNLKTGGSTTFGTVLLRVTTQAHSLLLGATGGTAPVFIVGEASKVAVSNILVPGGGTLRLEASEHLYSAASTAPAAASPAVATLEANSHLSLPSKNTFQTFVRLDGRGDVEGFGTVRLLGGMDNDNYGYFRGSLKDTVNLTLVSGYLALTNQGSGTTTDGTIRIGDGATLMSQSDSTNVFGNAVVAFENGTLRFNIQGGGDTAVPNNIHFEGSIATIESTGLPVTLTGNISFGTTVGSVPGEGGGLIPFQFNIGGSRLASNTAEDVLASSIKDPDWVLGAQTRLVKRDNGTWVLGDANTHNTYTGGTQIANGTLKLGTDNAIPAGTALTLGGPTSAGTLDLNGYSLDISSLASGGSLVGTTIVNSTVRGGRVPLVTWAVNDADQSYNADLGLNAGGARNNYTLAKAGAGTLTLSGYSYYTGGTRVQAGTLAIGRERALPTAGEIRVSPGATFDVVALDNGATIPNLVQAGSAPDSGNTDLRGIFNLTGGRLEIGSGSNTITLAASSTLRLDGTLNVNRADSTLAYSLTRFPSGTNSLLDVNTLNLNTAANLDFNMVDGYITPGTYALIQYDNISAATGDALNNLILPCGISSDPRYAFNLAYDTISAPGKGRVILTVTSSANTYPNRWTGGIIGAETRWSAVDDNFRTTDPDLQTNPYVPYSVSASAIFDDSASGYDVYLPAVGVVIGHITFNNDRDDYSVSGLGAIDGEGTFTKRGTRALTLNTANTYRGVVINGVRQAATYLEEGTLILGNDGALGPDALKISGGTLAKYGTADRNLANAIIFSDNARTVIDSGDDGTFTLAGTLSGGNANTSITKAGEGRLSLTGDVSAYKGTLNIPAGILSLKQGTDLSGSAVSLSGTATLELAGLAGNYSYKFGSLSSGSEVVINSANIGTKTLEVGSNNESTTFAGKFDSRTDMLALVKTGTGALALTGDNSGLTGGATVQVGILRVGDGVTGTQIPGTLTLEGTSRLILNLPVSHSLTTGSGTFVSGPQTTTEKLGNNTLSLGRAYDSLAGTLIVSAGTLNLYGSGTFGTASIVNNAVVGLSREDSFTFDNNISGTGVLQKYGEGTATYLGKHTGTGTTYLNSGSLQFGDSVTYNETLKDQKHLAAIVTSRSTALLLAPAEGTPREPGKITLGDVSGSGKIVKTGAGVAKLIGLVQIHDASNCAADILVQDGELSIGDGDSRNNGRQTLNVTSTITVVPGATLATARTGATYLNQPVNSEGLLDVRGDLNGDGLTVLASAANRISGKILIQRAAVLQVGDSAATSRLNDGASNVEIALDPLATLRFTNVATGNTGASITLYGLQENAGIVEYNGGSTLHFNSATDAGANRAFTGTLLASNGTFSIDTADIPAGATLNATSSGNILVLAPDATTNGTTALSAKLGSGNGSITLGSKTGAPAIYELPQGATFGGAVAVGENTTLNLTHSLETAQLRDPSTPASVSAASLRIENGGTLKGNGTVDGDLNNLIGGTIKPGNSVGQINVTGNFFNAGSLDFDLDSAQAYDSIHYTGAALLDTTGTLTLRLKKSTYENLPAGAEIKFLVDDSGDAGAGSVIGNFAQNNILLQLTEEDGTPSGAPQSRQFLTYNKGDGGLTLLFADSIGSIKGLNLHSALDGWEKYLNEGILNGNNQTLINAVSKILGAPDVSRAFNAASPVGLAALTAMPLAISRNSSDILHSHLESVRFGRRANGNRTNTQPYILATGVFESNGDNSNDPAFDYRTYGGIVGVDQNVGERLVLGLNAGYGHGNATLDYTAGTIKQDSARATLYGTYILDSEARWYADAAISAGYNSYDIKHRSALGTAKADPEGYDIAASFTIGGILSVPNGSDRPRFHLTPYAGVEYAIATVDSFTESGHDAALKLYSFNQDSLRAKIGTGFNWQVPTYADFALRIGIGVSYTRELLDTEASIRARLAADSSGNSFRTNAPATAQDFVQIGPVVDVDFLDNMTFQFNYQFGSDLRRQQVHQINAAFRIRF